MGTTGRETQTHEIDEVLLMMRTRPNVLFPAWLISHALNQIGYTINGTSSTPHMVSTMMGERFGRDGTRTEITLDARGKVHRINYRSPQVAFWYDGPRWEIDDTKALSWGQFVCFLPKHWSPSPWTPDREAICIFPECGKKINAGPWGDLCRIIQTSVEERPTIWVHDHHMPPNAITRKRGEVLPGDYTEMTPF